LGLGSVLSCDHADQAAADDRHGEGQHRGIDRDCEHQVSGHGQDMTEDADDQITSDIPENADENPGAEHCREQSDSHGDRRVRRRPRVLGDPVFGVLVLAHRKSEVTEEIVRQPTIYEMPAQPGAPFALCRHARPYRQDRHEDAQAGERQKDQCLGSEGGTIPAAEGVEEIAAPVVQAILDHQLQQHSSDHERGEQPSPPRGAAIPEARGTPPETRHQEARRVRLPALPK